MKLADCREREWSARFILALIKPYKVLKSNLQAKFAMWYSWIGPIVENAVESINLNLPSIFMYCSNIFS